MTASVPTVQKDPRLDEFVDREKEMAVFRRFLTSGDKPFMVVSGNVGLGKSWLLLKMMHECAVQGIRKAVVVWQRSEEPDYLLTMRKLRDCFDAKHFGEFTDLVNFYTDAAYKPQLKITLEMQGPLNIAGNLNQAGGTIGDITGISIRDNFIAVPRLDTAISEAERRGNLTARFLEGIARVTAAEPIVLFFDGSERMSDDTYAWLWEQLLEPVRAGLIPNLHVVICGGRPARGERDWAIVTANAQLRPLEHAHIAAYIERVVPGLAEGTRADLADLILANSDGVPARVASQVQMFRDMRERRTDASG